MKTKTTTEVFHKTRARMLRAEFERKAHGLPFLRDTDLGAEVVEIEPIDRDYFRDGGRRQRCIVRRDGALFVAFYD